jgi:effector-binding domain-containing protein
MEDMSERNTEQVTLQPDIVLRAGQPYVAVERTVRMDTMQEIADRIPEVLGWLADQGIAPAGPPFLRYRTIDMAAQLQVEAGVPVASAELAARAGGDLFPGALPSGRYAAATHTGRPEGLVGAVRELLDWAAARGLVWDMATIDGVEHWGCRIESYLTDPRLVPDMDRWETRLLFRLAD